MRRVLLVPLVLLLALQSAPADESPAVWLDLSGATVLASPGMPSALQAHLPAGRKPERLRWPFPAEGPVLVLGLPESDVVAQEIAGAFGLPASADELRGGYGIWAWDDGKRPLALVFGADPAALYATRFELETEVVRNEARSIDFTEPTEEAATVVRSGQRIERPRYASRGLAPGADLERGAEHEVAGARANRLWLDLDALGADRVKDLLPRLREQGVAPVLAVRHDRVPAEQEARKLGGLLRIWQESHGIRHVAIVFEAPWAKVARAGRNYGKSEAAFVAALAKALRPAGLEELIVVPRCISDRQARQLGAPPDLRGIPEALIAWSGPLEQSMEIPAAAARRRAKEAGVPVLLYETWAEPFQGAEAPAHIPAMPRGRDPELGEILAGIVVVGARGTDAVLESAWSSESTRRTSGAELLGPLLPLDEADDRAFLLGVAQRLDIEAQTTGGFIDWMKPWAARLRQSADSLAKHVTLRVPVVPASVTLDGKVDEAAWAYAREIPFGREGVKLLVLSDGSSLVFALRVDHGHVPVKWALPLVFHPEDPKRRIQVRLRPRDTRVRAKHPYHAGHVRVVHAQAANRASAEILVDRFALDGDAHATRCIAFAAYWEDPEQASLRPPSWPPYHPPRFDGVSINEGLLVIGP